MTEPRQAWEQVGQGLSGLGVKIKHHLDHDVSDEGDQTGNEQEPKAEQEVASALKRLGDALEDAVEALGNAAKDPAVKEDVKSLSKSFLEALSVTMETAGEKVRDVVEKRRAAGDPDTTPPPPEGSTPPPPADPGGPVPPTPATDDDPQVDDGLAD